ncbi:MAG: class I SAM-dependent methyltransferase [Candidatus Harrisonbacteria bacterium]|nr:class I SAM-dependent methyltransferase [Candidatus Harrisonbacteria bacterium]
MAKFYKNDYKLKNDLKVFANTNPFGKLLKPFLKNLYKSIENHLPEPRDFLLKSIRKNGVCAEIGVYNGLFSKRIIRISKPQQLYLIDPWLEIPGGKEKYNQDNQDNRYSFVLRALRKEIDKNIVHVIRKKSDEAVSQFYEGFFDFIYIDGDHSYFQVKKDLENFYSKMKKGGVLAGDDYHLPEVKQAVDEFAQNHHLQTYKRNNQFVIQI